VYLSFETIKKIKFGKVLIKGCRVVCGYDCVWVWKWMCVSVGKSHVYIYNKTTAHSGG